MTRTALAKLLRDAIAVNQKAMAALKGHDSDMDGVHPQTDRDAWYALLGIRKRLQRAAGSLEALDPARARLPPRSGHRSDARRSMTVAELIYALQAMPPDLPVWASGDDRECPVERPRLSEQDDDYPRRVTL